MKEIKLRPWQADAQRQAIDWYNNEDNKHFVINAAPGSGKTICASVIARELIKNNMIDRVIVIAPRTEIVRQWGNDFEFVTGRHMMKVTSSDDIDGYGEDLCATWAAIQNLQEAFHSVCSSSRTLVICDEHHHAAVKAAWGDGANSSFSNAKYVLILTGTPIRSDGQETVWMAYDSNGRINHPVEGTYTLSYGKAVDLGYCRPVTFHRHEGNFSVSLAGETLANVNSQSKNDLTKDKLKITGLQQALDFYKLACTRQFKSDQITPDVDSYQGTMIKWGINKLNETRLQMPDAGGLIIAPNIATAEHMCNIIELLEGEKPAMVHSNIANAEQRIASFRRSNKRWMVSVAMVSEGVDIKRLRVLIYLPSAQTELFFRQAIGRVVRTIGENDMTSAYVVMPSLPQFEKYALRVESEMPAKFRSSIKRPTHKVCPTCETECSLGAQKCDECGHEFFEISNQLKSCHHCGHLNDLNNDECDECGSKLKQEFIVELKNALRDGAIIRGMDLKEEEVKFGEEMGDSLIKDILSSGDDVLIKLLNKLPKESFARLAKMTSQSPPCSK